jgi:threonine/homoserine/homoserine lactone efflux protein
MIKTLIQGIVLGFTVAVIIGPAFFTLIQTSIHRGFKQGVLLSIGIFFSDLTLVVFCGLGATQVVYEPKQKMILGVVSGIVLILFGAFTFNRKVYDPEDETQEPEKLPKPFTYVVKGFFLNFANPFIWIFWLSVVGAVSSTYSSRHTMLVVFLSGTLATMLMTDIIKSFIANRIKRILSIRFMTWLNRIVGIVLIVFGILLMLRVLFDSGHVIDLVY